MHHPVLINLKKFKPNGSPRYTFEELHYLDEAQSNENNNFDDYYGNSEYENTTTTPVRILFILLRPRFKRFLLKLHLRAK